MRPEELAAHSRAVAAKNERTVLAVLATAGSTGVRAGRDLAELADLAPRDRDRDHSRVWRTADSCGVRVGSVCTRPRRGEMRRALGCRASRWRRRSTAAIALFSGGGAARGGPFVARRGACSLASRRRVQRRLAGFHLVRADQDRQDLACSAGVSGLWAGRASGGPVCVSPDARLAGRPPGARRRERDGLAGRALADSRLALRLCR